MFNIIDRYIAKTFLSFFIGGLLVVVTLFLAFDFMGNFSKYASSAPLSSVLEYYLYMAPATIYQMIPVACLLSTVFTLSTMSRSGELTALFSLGMSLARVSAPILVLVAVVSGLSFFVGDRLLPWLAEKKNYVFYVEIKQQPELFSMVKTNKIWYRSQNVLFNIKTLQPEKHTAQGVTLYYFGPHWNLVQMLTAQQVHIQPGSWLLENGNITVFPEEKASPITSTFKEKTIQMSEQAKDLQSRLDSSEVLTLSELKQFVKKNQEAGLDTLQYEVQYHAKFGFAFAAFVMSCMGVPFSVGRARSAGTFASLGICLFLAFLYWAVYSSAQTLATHGHLKPVLSAWAPNILFLGIAMLLISRLKR